MRLWLPIQNGFLELSQFCNYWQPLTTSLTQSKQGTSRQRICINQWKRTERDWRLPQPLVFEYYSWRYLKLKTVLSVCQSLVGVWPEAKGTDIVFELSYIFLLTVHHEGNCSPAGWSVWKPNRCQGELQEFWFSHVNIKWKCDRKRLCFMDSYVWVLFVY